MPIYEYDCRSCGQRFEALVLGAQVPECPECGAPDPRKLLSAFAVGHTTVGPCGESSCPPPGGG